MPKGFRKYLEGVEKSDGKIISSGFIDEGIVQDVGRLIEGQEAIEIWADNEVIHLSYDVMKIEFHSKGVTLYNRIRFGNSSSGFYASYDLTLDKGYIEYANLQYSDESMMIY